MPELLKKMLSVFAEMFPGRHSTNEVGSSMPVYGPEALSLEYRRNRDAILGGDIPEKYTRLIDLVPGDRVLELGAAEGVLSLLLARTKASVIALEKKDHRHEEAQRLQATCRRTMEMVRDQASAWMSTAVKWCWATSRSIWTYWRLIRC